METFSYSRLGTYDTCPKKYVFSYIDKAPRDGGTIEAFMGSRVHEALERLYRDVRMARAVSEDELAEWYHELWDSAFSSEVRTVRANYTAADYRAVGERALRMYHRRYQPFDDGVTMGLEQRIDLDLDGMGDYRLIGYVDRIVRVDDGIWEIHDYKTGQTLPTQQQVDEDAQLALYQLALEKMYPDVEEVTLVWHYLVFDHELRSKRTPAQLEQLRSNTIARIDTIRRQTTFPAKATALCEWCEYRALCPAHAHEARVAVLAPDERERDNGVALVDEYIGLTERISALESERDRVRDDLVAFADAHAYDAVSGSAGSVRVFRYTGVALPSYDDPRRDDIARILKDAERWDAYSTIAAVRLSRAIERKELSADTMEQLAPLVRTADGAKLYIRGRKG